MSGGAQDDPLGASPLVDLGQARNLGALLDTAFSLYRRHFLVFAASALVVVTVVDGLLLGLGVGVLLSGPHANRGWGWAVAAALAPSFIATPLVTAMHVRIVQSLSRGRRPSVGEALTGGLAVFPLVALVVLLTALGTALALVLLILPGIYLGVLWFVSAQAAVVEAPGSPVAALRRSHALVQGSWWRVFGIALLLGTIGALMAAIVSLPLAIVGDHTDSGPLSLLSSIAGDAISLSFVALTGTLLYFDLVAREGAADTQAVAA